jgi:hypothetical protein
MCPRIDLIAAEKGEMSHQQEPKPGALIVQSVA